jgi:hypothetical protein
MPAPYSAVNEARQRRAALESDYDDAADQLHGRIDATIHL